MSVPGGVALSCYSLRLMLVYVVFSYIVYTGIGMSHRKYNYKTKQKVVCPEIEIGDLDISHTVYWDLML